MNEPRRLQVVKSLAAAVEKLAQCVPLPMPVLVQGRTAFRYVEKSPAQALVLKAARYVSGLNAAGVLLKSGYLQEQATIQRTLDEIGEDIVLIALGILVEHRSIHDRYLAAFWQEEFDEGVDLLESTRRRHFPKRSSIRAAVLSLSPDKNPRAESVFRVIYSAYSGYLHAAGPNLMEMFDPRSGKLIMNGQQTEVRSRIHSDDLANYVVRGTTHVAMVALALGRSNLFEEIRDLAD